MRSSMIRIPLFVLIIILIAFIFYQYTINFTGEGKDSPEEALPTDQDYEWIEGPKTEKEIRYFFLANGDFFGTGVVTKNLKGWSKGHSVYAKIPRPIDKNQISAAFSDEVILFGLVKPVGTVTVTVNNKEAHLQSLDTLSSEILQQYEINDCTIWYIEFDELEKAETYHIQVLDEKKHVLDELSI